MENGCSLTSLLEVFSIEVAGPFPTTREGFKYLLVCVENFTGWIIARESKDAAAETVVGFIQDEVMHSFGPHKKMVGDNASCFTPNSFGDFMAGNDIGWKIVFENSPMSNGRADRMVGTI